MKRRLITILSGALLALATAGVASADTWFNPVNETGFLGRGDVIAAIGKAGLVLPTPVPQPGFGPFLTWNGSHQFVQDCLYSDGTSARVSSPSILYFAGVPEARLAPGNGNITGYLFGPQDAVFSGGEGPPGCFETPPPEGATLVDVQTVSVSGWLDTRLAFEGVTIPYTLITG